MTRHQLIRGFHRAGFTRNMVSRVTAVQSTAYACTCYRVEIAREFAKQGEFDTDFNSRAVLGVRCTTPEGAIGILRDRELKGSTDLRMIFFKAYLDGSTVEHAAELFEKKKTKDAPKNQAGVVFELQTRGIVTTSHNSDYAAFTQERGVGGTYWDEYVTMNLRQISHFRAGKENRWSAHPDMVTLQAFWVEPNALAGLRII